MFGCHDSTEVKDEHSLRKCWALLTSKMLAPHWKSFKLSFILLSEMLEKEFLILVKVWARNISILCPFLYST